MAVTGLQQRAYRWFRHQARQAAKDNPRLAGSLLRAHITVRPDVYLATQYFIVLVVFAISLFAVLLIITLTFANVLELRQVYLLLLVPTPFLLATVVYLIGLALPELQASSRARDIDAKLPYALNFIATMASAGTKPAQIFRSLSRQPIYKEVANEAAWIARDMDLLGMDIVTALDHGMDRTPSLRFQDFLQGAVTALTSGSDLKAYFLNKSEQFMVDNRQDQKNFLEGLGVLAESFVVVVVAAPLFLIVILSIMSSFGADARQTLQLGYVLILIMLPLAQVGYAMTVKASTPEA